MSQLTTNNPIALQALLSETLFVPKETEAHVSSQPPVADDTSAVETEEFIYQGDKSTGVLFILRYPDFPYFSPQAEEAFVKTIGALQLTKENVAVVNLASPHRPTDCKRMMQFCQPTEIPRLGLEPIAAKRPEIAHSSYMTGRVATVFHTFSLDEMLADVQKKRLFWHEFKTFIGS